MVSDIDIIEKLSRECAVVRKRFELSRQTQWGWSAYARRALVIVADRARTAAYDQTPENIDKALAARDSALGVFDALDSFVSGVGNKADIESAVWPLEDSYLRDFPQSRLAHEIRQGQYPI